LVFRFGTVYGKIDEASVYYSTSDTKGYEAGVWLRNHFPSPSTAVVTEVPGFWFRMFSGKTVIAATNPIIERNLVSESVLHLSYEMEHQQTLVTAYEAKGDLADEASVKINDVWNRVSFSSAAGDFINYTINGVRVNATLSDFTKETSFAAYSTNTAVIQYNNEDLLITKTVTLQNNSYPIDVHWTVKPLRTEVSDVKLYVTIFFDLQFAFKQAFVPGLLDWQNPWNVSQTTEDANWTTVEFSPTDLTDNYVAVYDDKNAVSFALKFNRLPDWGNIGALKSRQIDAIRFQHNYNQIPAGNEVTVDYQVLTFSKSSNLMIQMPADPKPLFAATFEVPFEVKARNYQDYIQDNDIQFIVYDKNQLDPKMVQSKTLELIYSNDRYVIFKIENTK
jgi:hypothetical protein